MRAASPAATVVLVVRDLAPVTGKLELADLLSGGEGFSGRRGGVIDPSSGKVGTIQDTPIGGDFVGNGQFQKTAGLSAVDGCVMPSESGEPTQIDSAGHRFTFPPTTPHNTVQICAGGSLPKSKTGNLIYSVLDGIDYAASGHSFLFLHPSAAVTFDLDAVRRLHPNTRVTTFRCVVGNPSPNPDSMPSDVFVLVDGQLRGSKAGVASGKPATVIDVPLSASERFLTLASTTSDPSVIGHQVIFGDPVFLLAP